MHLYQKKTSSSMHIECRARSRWKVVGVAVCDYAITEVMHVCYSPAAWQGECMTITSRQNCIQASEHSPTRKLRRLQTQHSECAWRLAGGCQVPACPMQGLSISFGWLQFSRSPCQRHSDLKVQYALFHWLHNASCQSHMHACFCHHLMRSIHTGRTQCQATTQITPSLLTAQAKAALSKPCTSVHVSAPECAVQL